MTPGNDEFEEEGLTVIEEDASDTDSAPYPDKPEPDPQVPSDPGPEPELIKLAEQPSPEHLTVEQFVAKVTEERNRPDPVIVVPPMTERQLSSRELEMRAGAARVEHFERQKVIHRPHVHDPREGHSTPVFVPKEIAGKDAKFGGGTPVG